MSRYIAPSATTSTIRIAVKLTGVTLAELFPTSSWFAGLISCQEPLCQSQTASTPCFSLVYLGSPFAYWLSLKIFPAVEKFDSLDS